jgi:phosphoserine aminotransferase
VLPVEVLEKAQADMLDQAASGMSVMEMSHRSKAYDRIIEDAEAGARELLGIPSDYKVLFLQGGASLQFTMLAQNFLPEGASADYVTTGSWGQKAVEAGTLEGTVREVWTGKAGKFRQAPAWTEVIRDDGSAYVHFTMNETIQGVDYLADPEGPGDFICDMSSCIGSRKMDYSRYAMVYAGAQKNLGPAGMTLVILRPDMLDRVPQGLPAMLDYRVQSENGSRFNTPPCWSIYMSGLVFRHWLDLGGIEEVEARNEKKAALLYSAIDGSEGFYQGHAVAENRSRMNVSFTLPSDELTEAFVAGAKKEGMVDLKGHRSVGGCRASIYNAMPLEGVEKLVGYMKAFASENL